MKIAIVDDNIEFLNLIEKTILHKFNTLNVCVTIKKFTNPSVFLDLYQKGERFEVVMLEYVLPEFNGFILGRKLRNVDKNFKLVYITFYEYAVFDCLKNNVFRFIRKANIDELDECIDSITFDIKRSKNKFMFKTAEYTVALSHKNILYFDFISRKVVAYCETEQHKLTGVSLNSIYDVFKDYGFIYIGRGTIVNLDKIKKIQDNKIILKNENTLFISKRKLATVKKNFLNFYK